MSHWRLIISLNHNVFVRVQKEDVYLHHRLEFFTYPNEVDHIHSPNEACHIPLPNVVYHILSLNEVYHIPLPNQVYHINLSNEVVVKWLIFSDWTKSQKFRIILESIVCVCASKLDGQNQLNINAYYIL